ncbi:MAG: AAA family ATPase, partial [Nocardioides sp.]
MGSRRCTDCGHDASERARFCEHCGAALVPGARPLRAPSALEARILAERTGIQGERKQVTVMYTDIVGSMELTRALDSERWGFVLDRFLAIAAGAVHAFEGTVNQFTGDGLLAVFGAPLAHEDHARRACLAVLELQRQVLGLSEEVALVDGVEFSIRCGLNSGEVVVGAIGDDVHMDFVPVGNTTALGKRIEELAPVGSTAVSASTAALVEGEFELRQLGEFDLKGVPTRQRIFELVGRGTAQTRLQATAATRGLSRFVGRETERATLVTALGHAQAGDGRAVGIVGEPGVGKSRLVHEFVADCAARGLPVTTAGGAAHGRYVPFLPVLALYRDHFGIGEGDDPDVVREQVGSTLLALDPTFEEDLPLLFEFLGASDAVQHPSVSDPVSHRRRLLEVAIRALTAGSRQETAVLVLEDLHWIDDASDAFLEELVEAVVGTRILLVTTYRGEYDDGWTNVSPHDRIALGPLDAEETGDLLTGLLGGDASLDGLSSLIESRTGGNPFFVEEVVQALAETGQLTGARGAYRLDAAVSELALPGTVQAGLAARIDRLPAREKALMQTMSVVGLEIPGPLLEEVAGLGRSELADAMELLERGQWVLPLGPHPRREYVFKHPLTQEVTYKSQLSQWRSGAHRMVAAAIERIYPDVLDERAALLAHHYEAADDATQAATWHARAADWARAASPADSLRHWRRVRDLAGGLEASAERDELAARSRIGLLSLAWRLGMAPDETAAIHAAAYDDFDQGRADLYFSGFLMHSGREREGLEGFGAVSRHATAAGQADLAFLASTGLAYASWIAGELRAGVETIDGALPLADDDAL